MGPLAILGILLPLLAHPYEDSAQSACLKVMTFNIRYGTAPDGDNSWIRRRGLTAAVIREHSPDVIGLQEALRFQIDELREEFPEYSELGVGRDDGQGAGEYSAILYRTSELWPDTGGTFWFSDTPFLAGSMTWGNRYPRVCTWAIFTERTTENSVAVFNLHWDHESQTSRQRSAELLIRAVNESAAGVPLVVMGDFNAGEQNPAVLFVRQYLWDSFRMLHEKDSLAGTYHAFRGTTSGEKIDHIFVGPQLTVAEAAIIRTDFNGRYPSDHFP
ncbi:MAG TPA: endonuclease/exonuclease/phosphatase family protein, partial [Bacteroidota bacterium]